MVLLRVGGLVWTYVTSFVSPMMLETGICGVVWVGIDSISPFSTFWVKPANVDHVSRAVMVMEGAGEFDGKMDSVGDKKLVKIGEN